MKIAFILFALVLWLLAMVASNYFWMALLCYIACGVCVTIVCFLFAARVEED